MVHDNIPVSTAVSHHIPPNPIHTIQFLDTSGNEVNPPTQTHHLATVQYTCKPTPRLNPSHTPLNQPPNHTVRKTP